MPWTPAEEELSIIDIGLSVDILIFTTVNAYRFKAQIEILKKIREASSNQFNHDLIIISVATRSPDDMILLEKYSDVVFATGGITPIQIEALVDEIFT